MIDLILALGLLVQEQDEVSPAQVMRRMEGLLDEVDMVSDELEADSGPESTTRALVRMTEAVFANSPYSVFSMHDREEVIAQATPAMDALMNYSGGAPFDYSLDFAANAFRQSEGETTDEPFCEAGAPQTIIDQALTDPEGHELTIRICWLGRMDPESGELTGSYLYQLNNGIYYVQYRGGIAGPDEDGINERLPMIERLIQPLVYHTVIRPASHD